MHISIWLSDKQDNPRILGKDKKTGDKIAKALGSPPRVREKH